MPLFVDELKCRIFVINKRMSTHVNYGSRFDGYVREDVEPLITPTICNTPSINLSVINLDNNESPLQVVINGVRYNVVSEVFVNDNNRVEIFWVTIGGRKYFLVQEFNGEWAIYNEP